MRVAVLGLDLYHIVLAALIGQAKQDGASVTVVSVASELDPPVIDCPFGKAVVFTLGERNTFAATAEYLTSPPYALTDAQLAQLRQTMHDVARAESLKFVEVHL